jgi:excisionase family DNA binding protein
MVEEKFLMPSEIAKMYNFTPQAIRKWIKEGKLKAIKIGSRWRVPESALKDFVAQK